MLRLRRRFIVLLLIWKRYLKPLLHSKIKKRRYWIHPLLQKRESALEGKVDVVWR